MGREFKGKSPTFQECNFTVETDRALVEKIINGVQGDLRSFNAFIGDAVKKVTKKVSRLSRRMSGPTNVTSESRVGELSALLKKHRLQGYEERLRELGINTVNEFTSMDFEQMVSQLGLKEVQQRHLRNAIDSATSDSVVC